jgi:hypothetical protein
MLRLQPISGYFNRVIAASMMKIKLVAPSGRSVGAEEPGKNASGRLSRHRLGSVIALVVVLISAMSLYVALLAPDGFGYYNDDAIYLTTARSLATGQGYRIISLPNQPAQTKYPPFYPFILSLVWRLYPGFPANLTALMMVSVLASIASAALAWAYLTTHDYASRSLATLAVLLAAINGFTVIFSIGLFSEMPYMALSIAALWLAQSREASRGSWSCGPAGGTALGLIMGLAFLTRVSGVTLVVAVAVYFMLHKRPRRIVLPLVIAVMFMIAWAGWCHYQRASDGLTNTSYFTSYLGYTYELIKERQARGNHSLPIQFLLIMKGNVVELAKSAPTMALGYCQERLGFVGDAGRKLLLASAAGLILIIAGARRYYRPSGRLLPIYIGLYVSLHLVLPYPDSSIERYLVPVLPFLILFLLKGIIDAGKAIRFGLARRGRAARRVMAAVAVLPLIAVSAFGLGANGMSLWSLLTELKPRWAAQRAADGPFISWIKANTRETDVLACVHHGMYYLYTGRKVVLSFAAGKDLEATGDAGGSQQIEAPDDSDSEDDSGEAPRVDPEDHPEVTSDSGQPDSADRWLRRILAENRVAYLIVTAEDISDKPGGVEFEELGPKLAAQGILKEVYESPDGGAIYKVRAGAR